MRSALLGWIHTSSPTLLKKLLICYSVSRSNHGQNSPLSLVIGGNVTDDAAQVIPETGISSFPARKKLHRLLVEATIAVSAGIVRHCALSATSPCRIVVPTTGGRKCNPPQARPRFQETEKAGAQFRLSSLVRQLLENAVWRSEWDVYDPRWQGPLQRP